ncbi:TPA: hypothetical protein ACGY73_002052 [Stenotrophomonas maltophilia]
MSRAASATLSPFTWLPMMFRSPAVATMLTSPWLRMVLPTADWSWLVWLALELEAPMPMPIRRLTPSVAPEAPCCMALPTPAAALAARAPSTRCYVTISKLHADVEANFALSLLFFDD